MSENKLQISQSVLVAAMIALLGVGCAAKIHFFPAENQTIDHVLLVVALILGLGGFCFVIFLKVSRHPIWTGSTGTVSLLVSIYALMRLLGLLE